MKGEPMVKDHNRWRQNDDGSWSRRVTVFSEVGVKATKAAITAAENLGVDLASVKGTGADGQITKADVQAAV